LRQRLVPGILRRLRRIGNRVEPFLVVSGGDRADGVQVAAHPYRFGFLDAGDIDALLRLEPESSREEVEAWFRDGKRCFGAKDGDRLVAKVWCDLERFSYPPNDRPLGPDEVYLFAAYADPNDRGRSVAPLMRIACCQALRAMGRTQIWSYTEYYNVAARRYKAKLGARDEALRLHLDLFGRWSKTVTLRRY
jgi:RimJ/RimL family protein N-acetyltransferase